MPELPEVEVLVRHLEPLLRHKRIRSVQVRRTRVLLPTTVRRFTQVLTGAEIQGLTRRGKYLLFAIAPAGSVRARVLVGHLGMTGRMYLQPRAQMLPKHAAVVLGLGKENFVFEDTRYFGRLTLDGMAVERLGPEPLSPEFTAERFARDLKRSSQSIKVKLLDQSLVAGIGNIYASEALFHAQISPLARARRLTCKQATRLWAALRETLAEAIEFGSTVPLDYAGMGKRDGLFYYGSAPKNLNSYAERLRVYDRAGKPCLRCRSSIKRIVQAARSTFYCPTCQRRELR